MVTYRRRINPEIEELALKDPHLNIQLDVRGVGGRDNLNRLQHLLARALRFCLYVVLEPEVVEGLGQQRMNLESPVRLQFRRSKDNF